MSRVSPARIHCNHRNMPVELSTVEDNSWLRGCAKEYDEYTAAGGESAHYIQCLFNTFLKCFPYRHVRNVDHEPHANPENAKVILAEDFGKVMEVSTLGSVHGALFDVRQENTTQDELRKT
jgi:hypothetical protein